MVTVLGIFPVSFGWRGVFIYKPNGIANAAKPNQSTDYSFGLGTPFSLASLALPTAPPMRPPTPAPTAVFLPGSVAQPLKSNPAATAVNKLCLIVII